MAKPFSETVNIQPQTISTGEPSQLLGLAGKLDQFASFTANIAAEKTIQSASAEGAAAFQQGVTPEFKEETFIGGIAKSAYNKALRSSYVASVDRDLSLGLNALKTEHSNDLVAFNDSANALIKGTVEGIDPLSRGMIAGSADNFMDSARIEVQANTINKQMDDADEEQSLSSAYYGAEADTFAFNGDNISSLESLNKVIFSNNARLDSGRINKAQTAELNDAAILSTKIATNRGELSRVMERPDGIRLAAGAIAKLVETPLKGMTLEQNDTLVKTLSSDLSQFITLQNRQEVADQATLTARHNNNFTQLMVRRAEGDLNQTQLNTAAKNGDISGTQFDKLTNQLASKGVGVTDIGLQLELQNSIIGGLDVTADITANAGVHLNQADAGALLVMQNEYFSDESVLNSSQAKRARTFLTESTKITGLLGRLTSDGSRRTAEAIRTFDTRVLAGEDPFVVADDLYDHDSITKVQKKLTRRNINTDDVPAALKQLEADYRVARKVTTRESDIKQLQNNYNRDLNDLNNLRTLQASQSQFANALKGAQ